MLKKHILAGVAYFVGSGEGGQGEIILSKKEGWILLARSLFLPFERIGLQGEILFKQNLLNKSQNDSPFRNELHFLVFW